MLSRFSHVWLFVTPWTIASPGSSVLGILQARIMEWIAMLFSRGSSWPRYQTCVSSSSCTAGRFFTTELLGKPPKYNRVSTKKFQVSWPWSVESPVFLFSLFLLPFEAVWYGPFYSISTHLPFPPLWFCYPITMYVVFVHVIKQFSDVSGVSYNSAQLWHSTWRLHQVPQFEASVLQDCSPPTSDANHKSRLLPLTDRI